MDKWFDQRENSNKSVITSIYKQTENKNEDNIDSIEYNGLHQDI
jgi:hypothetical protein